jgi:hypothetical protein
LDELFCFYASNQTGHIMKRTLMVSATVAAIGLPMALQPAQAGGNGGAVAAGVLGGLAAGAIIGGAVAQPRYYAPAPVYEVEPAYAAPRCYMTRGEPVWDAYRGIWVRPRVRVCD